MSLLLQSSIGLVPIKRYGTMKTPRCQKLFEDRDALLELSLIMQGLLEMSGE